MKPNSIPQRDQISAVDYRLIGISPQYWSYTPLLIGDLVGLPLINGVDCFISHQSLDPRVDVQPSQQSCGRDAATSSPTDRIKSREDAPLNTSKCSFENGNNQQNERDGENNNMPWHIVPLSRVLLRGIATTIDKRPNGNTLIVLDDGTGCIDCLYRDDMYNGNNAYLSSFFAQHEQFNDGGSDNVNWNGFRFSVGDSLEVMGKIKVLTAGSIKSNACKQLENCGSPLEVRFGCVREIHATSVCVIGTGQSRMANQWNGEVVHWLKCIDFTGRVANQHDEMQMVRNGKEVLPFLGERIASSVLNENESRDYTNLRRNGTNTVLHRKCCQTPKRFRKELFYCHCEATLETLDPTLQFRDALLHHLLDMEMELHSPSDSAYPSATEDVLDMFGAKTESTPPPLLVRYETISRDERISSALLDVVSSTKLPEVNALRLIRKTFSAMTKDGILSLYDQDKDLYLLVSRTRVIEPYLMSSKGVDAGSGGVGPYIPPPFFIRSVPRKRISEVWSWIENGRG